jgi:hypothetical protein
MKRRYFRGREWPTLRTDLFRPPPQGQLELFNDRI